MKKKWNLDELPKFEKNFYQEHPDLARRTAVSDRLIPVVSSISRSDQKSLADLGESDFVFAGVGGREGDGLGKFSILFVLITVGCCVRSLSLPCLGPH